MDVESSHRTGRGRLVTIVTTVVVTLAAASWAAFATWGAAATTRGHALYAHRLYAEIVTAPRTDAAPLVAWLGDSTLMGESFPSLMAPRIKQRYGVESRILAAMGLSSYSFYELMGPVLALRPAVIVTIAHLRNFYIEREGRPPPPGLRSFDDLASMIPTDELPRAILLPWQFRGVSLARLGLLRLLRFPTVEKLALMTDGLQTLAQELDVWTRVVAKPPVRPEVSLGVYLEGAAAFGRAYDIPLSRGHPYVRMLGETVRMAARRGVRVLVVGSPIPWEAIKQQRGYDPAVYAARFAVLRDAVERNGGTFLDYHEALTSAGFRDNGGHYNEAGAAALAERLDGPVSAALEAALGAGGTRRMMPASGRKKPPAAAAAP